METSSGNSGPIIGGILASIVAVIVITTVIIVVSIMSWLKRWVITSYDGWHTPCTQLQQNQVSYANGEQLCDDVIL